MKFSKAFGIRKRLLLEPGFASIPLRKLPPDLRLLKEYHDWEQRRVSKDSNVERNAVLCGPTAAPTIEKK